MAVLSLKWHHKGKRAAAGLLSLLLAVCSFALVSCGQEETMGENACQVYYLSTSETKVEQHYQEVTSDTPEGKLEELVQFLSTNPEKLEYKAPLAMGFQLLSIKQEGATVLLDMDAAYLGLPTTTEILVRAAIVRTLTQLENVSYVGITVEDSQLYDSMGRPVGWMNAEQFIDNDGNEINTYELARVKLYFAAEDGLSLISAYREKYYSTSMQLERFVVEELIAGPSGKVEGLYPCVNPNTKVINVTTRDGICFVNLDENFLTVVNNVPTEESIYAIVNSLVELSYINKVQILINGEVPSTFSTSVFERNLDIVTTLEK
ncbi:MAG: GerMN domain-containing protein [Acetatifactor sp.]|nr:GerMN domain-containing protein [Acetatifactor sp.]